MVFKELGVRGVIRACKFEVKDSAGSVWEIVVVRQFRVQVSGSSSEISVCLGDAVRAQNVRAMGEALDHRHM